MVRLVNRFHEETKLIPAIICIGVVTLLAVVAFSRPLQIAWLKTINLPPEKLMFADAWVIAAGAESYSQGLDPLNDNPHDPWGRPMNYPRVVAWLGHAIGIQTHDALLLGGIFVSAFLILLSLVFVRTSVPSALLFSLLTLSPPVVFGIERGNLDLLIFAGVAALGLHSVGWILAGTIFVLTSIKLYPFFACISTLAAGKKYFFPIIAGCTLYFIFIRSDLNLIRSATPHQAALSWGVGTFAINLRLPWCEWLSRLLALFLLSLSFTIGNRRAGDLKWASIPNQFVSGVAGAAIFAGCFILGTNFTYRMMFLLLPGAFLLRLIFSPQSSPNPSVSLRDKTAFGAIVLSCWLIVPTRWLQSCGIRGAWLLSEIGAWLGLIACGYILGLGVQLIRRSPS